MNNNSLVQYTSQNIEQLQCIFSQSEKILFSILLISFCTEGHIHISLQPHNLLYQTLGCINPSERPVEIHIPFIKMKVEAKHKNYK